MGVRKPRVCIVGCYQNGKSTLVNCLLDDQVAWTGDGCATTHISSTYTFGEIQKVELQLQNGGTALRKMRDFVAGTLADATEIRGARVRLWKPLLKDVDIIDTPGFNANDKDTEAATASLNGADYVFIVVRNTGLSQPEIKILEEVVKLGLSCSILMNCWNSGGSALWSPEANINAELAEAVEAQVNNAGLAPLCRPIAGDVKVWRCNLLWFWWASGHLEDVEKPEEVARCREELEKYFKKTGIPPAEVLAEKSGVLPIRDYFQRSDWHLLAHGAGHTRVAVQHAVSRWEQGVKQAIKDALANLKGEGGVE